MISCWFCFLLWKSLYAGVVEAGNELAYSDGEEDEEDDDPNQVVDLESDSNDEPKKKKAKVSA
jgi:hypothetical protein